MLELLLYGRKKVKKDEVSYITDLHAHTHKLYIL